MLNITMTIALDKLEEVETRLKRLNTKREKKLGMPPVTMTQGTPFIDNQIDPNDPAIQVPVELVELRFSCQPVKINGWEFVCMLERVKDEYNIISWANAAGMEKYRDEEIRCDHCGQNRKRKYAAIIEDDEGSEMMVGSTCLVDFLGQTSAQAVSSMRDLANFEKALKGDANLQRGFPMVPLADAVDAAVRVIIGQREYLSSAKARSRETSATWECLWVAMHGQPDLYPVTAETQAKTPLVMKHLEATHATAKAAGINTSAVEDFNYKVFLMVEMAHIRNEPKWLAILAGAVSYALRKLNSGNKRATLPGFWGSVGQRSDGMFKPVKVIPTRGYYGRTWLVIGTMDNHKCVWWATSEAGMKAVVNNGNGQMRTTPVKVAATVKTHKQGKYGEETVVKQVWLVK
jgi:hypothetical protein